MRIAFLEIPFGSSANFDCFVNEALGCELNHAVFVVVVVVVAVHLPPNVP